jgi:hypothetical protein
MRLSAKRSEPGYHPAAFRPDILILLDGEEIHGVVTADDEEGYLLCHDLDKDGKPRLDETRREILTIERRGRVEICFTDDRGGHLRRALENDWREQQAVLIDLAEKAGRRAGLALPGRGA